MKASKLVIEFAIKLAEEFLETDLFYKKVGITPKELLKAYSCKVESRGGECDDGWNPVEHNLIEMRMGSTEIRRNGEYVLWAVLADAFESWLSNIFLGIGKEGVL